MDRIGICKLHTYCLVESCTEGTARRRPHSLEVNALHTFSPTGPTSGKRSSSSLQYYQLGNAQARLATPTVEAGVIDFPMESSSTLTADLNDKNHEPQYLRLQCASGPCLSAIIRGKTPYNTRDCQKQCYDMNVISFLALLKGVSGRNRLEY